MMATSHSVSGALMFAALAPAGASLGLYSLDTTSYIVGTMVCAGAALLPDIDHPKARISNSIPPFTRWLASWVAVVAGGHRHMTHTIWFVILSFFVAAFQNYIFYPLSFLFTGLSNILPTELGQWAGKAGEAFQVSSGAGGAFLIILYMVTMGLLASNIPIVAGLTKSRKAAGFAVLPPVLGALGAWWVVQFSGAALYGFDSWIPWAIAVGALTHDLGDMLTSGKVPFFELPFDGIGRRNRIGIPILGDTSSSRESLLRGAMGVAFLAFLALGVYGFISDAGSGVV